MRSDLCMVSPLGHSYLSSAEVQHDAKELFFSAATPERIVAAKRFMGKLDKLYKVLPF